MIRLRDVVIILCLLGLAAFFFIINDKGEGSRVRIEYNGDLYTEIYYMSLEENEERIIHLNGTVIVVDKNGAYLAESECPTKSCVRSGRINRVGQTVVCIPQRVSIRIEGGNAEFDAKTG